MRVAVRASRLGLLLAVLLVLFGMSVAVAPGTGGRGVEQYPAPQHRVSVLGESASPAPSAYDDLQDWLRLSAGTLRAPATALPDTWWAVRQRAFDGCDLQEQLLLGEGDHAAMAAATPTPRASRAPPFA